MKEEDGKHHDDARRGIEQNGRDRQRRQFDGCKIADIEEKEKEIDTKLNEYLKTLGFVS